MIINITGDGLELTNAIQEYTNERLAKLKKHYQSIIQTNVILSLEHKKQKAEATIIWPHSPDINISVISDNLYSSIDELILKLDQQCKKIKEKTIKAERSQEKTDVQNK